MNNKIFTVNGRDYALCYVSAQIKLKELIYRYRDTEKLIAYCKECNRYNACHAFPPFDFDSDEYLSPYQTACKGTSLKLLYMTHRWHPQIILRQSK